MPELSGVRDNTGTSLSTVNSCLSVPLQKSSRRSLDLYMHDAKKQTKLKMKPENLVRYYIRFKSAPRIITPIYQISRSEKCSCMSCFIEMDPLSVGTKVLSRQKYFECRRQKIQTHQKKRQFDRRSFDFDYFRCILYINVKKL